MRVGVILAGGESRRFQGNKLLVKVDNKPVIRRVYDVFKEYVDKIYFSIKDESRYHELSTIFSGEDVNYLYDYSELSGGPYVGIITALDKIEAEEFIIVPGDTPWLNKKFFERWLSRIEVFKPVSSSVIWGNGMLDSLFLYIEKRRIRSIIKLLYLMRRNGRATDIIRASSYTYLARVSELVDDPVWLAHINTREDLTSPSPRNPLKGFIDRDIHIKWEGISKIPFLNALDKINLGEYREAITTLLEEANRYNEVGVLHLIDHVVRDISDVINMIM